MSSDRLIRWSGILLIFSGILLFFLGILPSILLRGDSILDGVLDRDWRILSLLVFIWIIVTPLALLGLYARQSKESGILGLVGILVLFMGWFFYAGIQFDLAFLWPILAVEAPSMIPPGGPMYSDSGFMVAHSLMGLLPFIGFIIFGIATIRARIFPRWSAVLFTVGLPLSVGLLFYPLIMRMVGAVLASPALTMMGCQLWLENGEGN